MMKSIVSAPEVLKSWISSVESSFDSHEAMYPSEGDLINKAVVHIEVGEYVCSFTIWGAGTTEWIVLEKKTGQDYEFEDCEFEGLQGLETIMQAVFNRVIWLKSGFIDEI